MRSSSSFWVLLASCLLQVVAATLNSRQTSTFPDGLPTPPPPCSLQCLTTMPAQFCGDGYDYKTNKSCICDISAQQMDELKLCVWEYCNVTESLSTTKYAADYCGIPSDKSRQNEQILSYEIMPPLTVFFVGIRFFTRWLFWGGIGADDWMILAAELCYLTEVAFALGMAIFGFGEHTWFLTVDEITNAQRFFYLSWIAYIFCYTFPKLSILLFYRRVFPQNSFRRACLGVGAFVILTSLALLFTAIFQCMPMHGNWTNWAYKNPPVKCIPTYTIAILAAGMSIFEDLLILLMPIPVLMRLNMHRTQRASLLGMFSVGSVVVLCSCLRVPSLLTLQGSQDPSYDQAPIAIWTHLELFFGIVCACLPACRSLVVHYLRSGKDNSPRPPSGRSPYIRSYLKSSKEAKSNTVIESKNEVLVLRATVEDGSNSVELTDMDGNSTDGMGRTSTGSSERERPATGGEQPLLKRDPLTGEICSVQTQASADGSDKKTWNKSVHSVDERRGIVRTTTIYQSSRS